MSSGTRPDNSHTQRHSEEVSLVKFKSVNETDQFSFRDSQLFQLSLSGDPISMELEALIVLPGNTQNTNYTESYAGTVQLRFTDARLLSAVRDGYRYRDPDGKLLSETPDQPLSEEALVSLPSHCEGAYLYAIEELSELNGKRRCALAIELPQAEQYDTLITDSYHLILSYEKAIFEWDHYMNRVQE